MKLKLVSLAPLKEIDVNDPALMRARAARDQMNQMKSNPRIGFDQALDLRDEKQDLEREISNLYREMESDPDIEPEGGPVADQYGDTLNRLEDRLYKINKQIASYDMSEGEDEDEDDEQDMADVKADLDSMMNESEDKWNAIDVSRKAEKAIGNREWNERTGKKLDMLKALNKAGKFKKDFDEETLIGWVDQNYSWERVTRQFKVNEIATELGYLNETQDQVLQVTTNNGEVALITDPRDIKDFLSGGGLVYGTDDSGASIELSKETSMDIQMIANEGSCGYGPDGVPGNTPGETKGMPADDRTKSIIKKLIQKEIKKLSEADPEAIKGKHYPDEETVKKLKKGPYASGGQNAQK